MTNAGFLLSNLTIWAHTHTVLRQFFFFFQILQQPENLQAKVSPRFKLH